MTDSVQSGRGKPPPSAFENVEYISQKLKRMRGAMKIHVQRAAGEMRYFKPSDLSPPGEGKDEKTPAIDKVFPVRVILNELTEDSIRIFVREKVILGAKIELVIHEPFKFFIRGQIMEIKEVRNEAHIITPEGQVPIEYRLEIQFELQNDEEKESVKSFCDDLKKAQIKEIPQDKKKAVA